MSLNPPTQYVDDGNLRARQRLWELQDPPFDIVGWCLDLAGVAPGDRVVDVGCGNGAHLRGLRARGADAVGVDLSSGMLRSAAPHPLLVNGDVQALPLRRGAADVVLAPHMLYHVPDRTAAAHELRRVLRPGGTCVVITNGAEHNRALRQAVEAAVGGGWRMRSPSTHAFSMENGAAQLAVAFGSVTAVRPAGVAPVEVVDPAVVADYVASAGDHYEDDVERPWAEVVAGVRRAVAEVIERDGAFVVRSDVGAFVCR